MTQGLQIAEHLLQYGGKIADLLEFLLGKYRI
jgi:hypothetical protein